MEEIPFSVPALVGALIQEVVHWYGLRGELTKEVNKTMLMSGWYWFWTSAMILLTPVAAFYWFDDGAPATKIQLLTGAAMPVLLRKAVRTLVGKEEDLGPESTARFTAIDYFRI